MYTDTDSRLLEIKTDDVYKGIESNRILYDTSDYPKEHPLYSNSNKKVLEKMKDECAGIPIAECVCRDRNVLDTCRPKKYQKSERCKKSVIKKQIMHEQYKETLFGTKQLWHGMNMLRSKGHEIYGMHLKKVLLSPFDSKRWIADDGIRTNAYGYMPALNRALTDAEMEKLSEFSR